MSIADKRKYFRIKTSLPLRIISKNNVIYQPSTIDISPLGLRFEVKDTGIETDDELELKIEIPRALNPIHVRAKVVWKRKVSTEDSALSDIGCEFTKIEEDNKNTFLKYLCDLLYQASRIDKKGE